MQASQAITSGRLRHDGAPSLERLGPRSCGRTVWHLLRRRGGRLQERREPWRGPQARRRRCGDHRFRCVRRELGGSGDALPNLPASVRRHAAPRQAREAGFALDDDPDRRPVLVGLVANTVRPPARPSRASARPAMQRRRTRSSTSCGSARLTASASSRSSCHGSARVPTGPTVPSSWWRRRPLRPGADFDFDGMASRLPAAASRTARSPATDRRKSVRTAQAPSGGAALWQRSSGDLSLDPKAGETTGKGAAKSLDLGPMAWARLSKEAQLGVYAARRTPVTLLAPHLRMLT